jgi:hypothetical protein
LTHHRARESIAPSQSTPLVKHVDPDPAAQSLENDTFLNEPSQSQMTGNHFGVQNHDQSQGTLSELIDYRIKQKSKPLVQNTLLHQAHL